MTSILSFFVVVSFRNMRARHSQCFAAGCVQHCRRESGEALAPAPLFGHTGDGAIQEERAAVLSSLNAGAVARRIVP